MKSAIDTLIDDYTSMCPTDCFSPSIVANARAERDELVAVIRMLFASEKEDRPRLTTSEWERVQAILSRYA